MSCTERRRRVENGAHANQETTRRCTVELLSEGARDAARKPASGELHRRRRLRARLRAHPERGGNPDLPPLGIDRRRRRWVAGRDPREGEGKTSPLRERVRRTTGRDHRVWKLLPLRAALPDPLARSRLDLTQAAECAVGADESAIDDSRGRRLRRRERLPQERASSPSREATAPRTATSKSSHIDSRLTQNMSSTNARCHPCWRCVTATPSRGDPSFTSPLRQPFHRSSATSVVYWSPGKNVVRNCVHLPWSESAVPHRIAARFTRTASRM